MQITFNFLKQSGKKAIILFVLTAVLVTGAVSGTVAYLVTRTRDVPNTFHPAEIEISSWSFDDLVNAGDTEVYVRATLVAAWVSNEDKRTVWAVDPVENTDYTLTIQNGWFKGSDGFYYRSEKMNAAQSVNFVHATQLTEKEGFTLRILVMYSAIQTEPASVVEESWRVVKVDASGNLVAKEVTE